MSEQEDMDHRFLGGGVLDFVVHGGEIYLSAVELDQLFSAVGLTQGIKAAMSGDSYLLAGAQLLIGMGQQFADLRSELLKREAEKLFNLDS